jgi:methylthioribulose-1-phosphate dehydratase
VTTASFPELAQHLAAIGRRFYTRGWALGTSGNFSAVMTREPLRLAITASAVSKGDLTPDRIVQIDRDGVLVEGSRGKASAEARLHLEIVRIRGAGAVLHTHSVWSTILSDLHAAEGGLHLEGFEMLKGLEGVTTHEHREWVPIFENDQDMERLAKSLNTTLRQFPASHAFLIRRHGLYTWGEDLSQAERHVEILEFLLETRGRTRSMNIRS